MTNFPVAAWKPGKLCLVKHKHLIVIKIQTDVAKRSMRNVYHINGCPSFVFEFGSDWFVEADFSAMFHATWDSTELNKLPIRKSGWWDKMNKVVLFKIFCITMGCTSTSKLQMVNMKVILISVSVILFFNIVWHLCSTTTLFSCERL